MNIKIKKILIISLITISFFLITYKASALIQLPRISTACETKSGEFYAFNDGFSKEKKCSGKDRQIVLIGEQGPSGIQGPQGNAGIKGETGTTGPQGLKGEQGPIGPASQLGAGNVAFIYELGNDSVWVLATNGKIYQKYYSRYYPIELTEWTINDAPSSVPIPVSDIVIFEAKSFIDKSGNVWAYSNTDSGGWLNYGHP